MTVKPVTEHRATLRNALIITRREVKDSFRDWRIVGPIIILTFFFPFLAQSFATSFRGFVEGFGAQVIGDRTIPFLLMIVGFFPISISLVIALETFVGEKERRSLEPLLSTPLTNTELYIGKTLAAMIPPLIASFGGMTVYLLSLAGSDLAWRPQPMLIVQIFLLTIVQALAMVTGAVVVSSQTTSTRAANLLASFIIIPMTLLINAESIIMFLARDAESVNGIGALWAIMVGMIVVVLLLLRVGNTIFNREELLGRAIDSLNIRGTIAKIGRYCIAVDDAGTPARNLIDWFRRAVPYSLRKLRAPALIAAGVFLVAFIGGYVFGNLPEWRLPLPEQDTGQIATYFTQFEQSVLQADPIPYVIVNNGRILLGALLLALFSFGVIALVLTLPVFAVLGYLFSQMVLSGYDLRIFFASILPHGVVELPVIIIGTAVALYAGSVITKPPRTTTVGHVWVVAIGDAIKLWLGVIIPLLIIGAVIEVLVTPMILRGVLSAI